MNIVNGEIDDPTRADLYDYVVDFLTHNPDHELVWKYADWALQKSEEVCASECIRVGWGWVVKTDKTLI